MVRQLPPPHLKTAGPTAPPPHHRFSTETTSSVVVNHYTGADKLIPAIPGFRTSAAFLTSLSANLRLTDDDLLPSPLLTPSTFPSSFSHGFPLPPPSPLSFSTSTFPSLKQTQNQIQNPYPSPPATASTMSTRSSVSPSHSRSNSRNRVSTPPPTGAGLPELSTYTTENEEERIAALRLIADSVAQTRSLAARALIFHPLHIAIYGLLAASISRYFITHNTDLSVIVTALAGVTMAFLAAVRWATGGYLGLAEEIGWEWLGDDRVIVVKWGEEVIGSLVLGWEEDEAVANGGKKKRGSGGKKRGCWAVVRAWTVRLKYRGKGVGEGLLEEAVRVASLNSAEGVRFAGSDGVVSKRILPEFYNGFLNKRDSRAQAALDKVAREKGNFGRRRYSPSHGSR